MPAVRGIFDSRFGAGRVRSGNEFTSVARGLALRAAEVIQEDGQSGAAAIPGSASHKL